MRKFEIVKKEFIKYDSNEINLPQRSTKHSVCYDFYSPITITLPAHKITLVWSNVKAIFNENEGLILATRSSMGAKGIMLANGIGIIESDYANNPSNDGNLGFLFFNTNDTDYVINKGDKMGQGMFINFLTIDNEEDILEDRKGGFGSTN